MGTERGTYLTRVNGNLLSGTVVVDENGILDFEHRGDGNVSISKSGDITPPQPPADLRISP